MTLPFNKHDIDPFRRAEIAAWVQSDIGRECRFKAQQHRRLGDTRQAASFELAAAEYEVRAEELRAEIEAAKYDGWLFSRRLAA